MIRQVALGNLLPQMVLLLPQVAILLMMVVAGSQLVAWAGCIPQRARGSLERKCCVHAADSWDLFSVHLLTATPLHLIKHSLCVILCSRGPTVRNQMMYRPANPAAV